MLEAINSGAGNDLLKIDVPIPLIQWIVFA